MQPNHEDFPHGLQQILKRYDDRMRLSRASELASSGRLLEAEAYLCPGRHLPMSVAELDMLARIHVKQGFYDIARRRWEDAIKTGERRDEFEECIKVLENFLEYKHQIWIWRVRLFMHVAAILLTFWLLIRLGLFSTSFAK